MVHYSLILAGLFSATLSAAVPAPQPEAKGLYTIPAAGLPNGVYDVDLNEDGTTHFTLVDVANPNFTLVDAADTTSAYHARNLLARDNEGPGCGTKRLSTSDIQQASNQWINFCGGGTKWSGRSKAFYYNGVVAYGCSYGGDQGCNKDMMATLYGKIANACGSDVEGYYSFPQFKAGYGYTV